MERLTYIPVMRVQQQRRRKTVCLFLLQRQKKKIRNIILSFIYFFPNLEARVLWDVRVKLTHPTCPPQKSHLPAAAL